MNQWHVDGQLLERYRDGRLGPDAASSVEAHVVSCDTCRTEVCAGFDPARLERGLHALFDVVDQPRLRPAERLLVLLRVRPDVARLVVVTPSLRGPWLGALAAVLALAAVSSHTSPYDAALFLLLAPVLPVVGVALAFGRAVDPAHELVAASPLGAFRLLLLRSVAVLATTVALTSAAAALTEAPLSAMAWLLPALALTSSTVALSTYVDPVRAAASLVLTWVVVASVSVRIARDGGLPLGDAIAAMAPFSEPGQVLSLTVALVGLVVTASRRTALDRGSIV